MAITNIQGTVTRVFYSGKGVEVTETYTSNGAEFKTRWTCWFDQEHGLSDGQTVKVSGFHGDKVDEWTDKQGEIRHSVKRSLNKARLQEQSPREEAAPVPSSSQESWAQPTVDNAEVPF